MKKLLGIAVLVSATLSGVAQAGITNNLIDATGTFQASDLVLLVSNSADPNNFYSRDLGVTMDQLLSATDATKANGSVVTAGVSMSFAGDSILQAFLSGHATGTNTFYLVGGNPGDGTGNTTLGLERYAFVANYDASKAARPLNSNIDGIVANPYTLFSNLDASMGAASSVVSANGAGDAGAGGAVNIYWTSLTNGIAVGGAGSLYALATSGVNSSNPGNALLFGAISMNGTSGNLTFTQAAVSAVPIPAALWLLGSGLMGLAGVGRRRAV
jgi:hypothetical protein